MILCHKSPHAMNLLWCSLSRSKFKYLLIYKSLPATFSAKEEKQMKKLITVFLLLGFIVPGSVLALDYLETDQSRYIDTPGFLGFVPDRFIVVLKQDVPVDHGKDMSTAVALSSLSGFDELAQKYDVARLKPQFPGADMIATRDSPDYNRCSAESDITRISEVTG